MDLAYGWIVKDSVMLIRLGGFWGCASIYVSWEGSVPHHRPIGLPPLSQNLDMGHPA